MKKAAECFSKFMFWLENAAYMMVFMSYEAMLFPLIYFKVALTIIFLTNWARLAPMLLFWLVIGPLVLVMQLARDTFYFVKILCDYMDEEDQYREKEEEDFRQDKIVIYNEVLDVMRSVAHMFRRKLVEARTKRQQLGEMLQVGVYDEQLLFGDNLNSDSRTSLTMEKNLIIEAWGRYRPSSKDNSPRGGVSGQNKKKDIQTVFGEGFLRRLISSVKQKTYLSKAERLNGAREGEFAKNKIQEQLNTLLLQGELKKDEDASDDGANMDDDDTALANIPEEEVQLIEDFLDKFIFLNDASSSKEQVDLNLALKALPLKIDETNIYRIDLINFSVVKKSLIGFQNDQQDELFEYYDNNNRKRLRKITKFAIDNEAVSEDIMGMVRFCHQGLMRLAKLLGTTQVTNTNLPQHLMGVQKMLLQGGGLKNLKAFSKVVPA